MEETQQPASRQDADDYVREQFDKMTRKYLRSVLNESLIEEHRSGPHGHHSEPLSRLLAWCQRRPTAERYSLKLEADGSYRIVRMSGRRGVPPAYAGEGRFSSLEDGRHAVLLENIKDLTMGNR